MIANASAPTSSTIISSQNPGSKSSKKGKKSEDNSQKSQHEELSQKVQDVVQNLDTQKSQELHSSVGLPSSPKIAETVIVFSYTKTREDDQEFINKLNKLIKLGGGVHAVILGNQTSLPFEDANLEANLNATQAEFNGFKKAVEESKPEYKVSIARLQKLQKCYLKDKILSEEISSKLESSIEILKNKINTLYQKTKIPKNGIAQKKQELAQKEDAQLQLHGVENSVLSALPPTPIVLKEARHGLLYEIQKILWQMIFLHDVAQIMQNTFERLSKSDKDLIQTVDYINSPLLITETVKYTYRFIKNYLAQIKPEFEKFQKTKETKIGQLKSGIDSLNAEVKNVKSTPNEKEMNYNQLNEAKALQIRINTGCATITNQIESLEKILGGWKETYKITEEDEGNQSISQATFLSQLIKNDSLNSPEVAEGLTLLQKVVELREQMILHFESIEALKQEFSYSFYNQSKLQENINARGVLREKLYVELEPIFENIEKQTAEFLLRNKEHQIHIANEASACAKKMHFLSAKWDSIIHSQNTSEPEFKKYETAHKGQREELEKKKKEFEQQLTELRNPKAQKSTTSLTAFILPALWSSSTKENE